MVVDLKEKLEPGTFLYYDGKQVISISRDELLGELEKKLTRIEEFNDSLLKRQQNFEERANNRFKKFLAIFTGGITK